METFLLSDKCLDNMLSKLRNYCRHNSNSVYRENARHSGNAINNHCEKILFQSKYIVPISPVDKLIEKNRMKINNKITQISAESRYFTRLKKKHVISEQNYSINNVEENKFKNIKNKEAYNDILSKNYTVLTMPEEEFVHVSHTIVKKKPSIKFLGNRRSKRLCNLPPDKYKIKINDSIYSVNKTFHLSNDTFKKKKPLNDTLLLEQCHKKINRQTAIYNSLEENSLLSPDEFEQVVSFNSHPRTKRNRRANFSERRRSKRLCNLPPDKIKMKISENINSVNNKTKLKKPFIPVKCTEFTKVKCASNVSICSDSFEKTHSLHKTYSKLPEIEEASFLPDTYSNMKVKQDNTSLNLFENTEKAKNQTENNKIESYSIFDKNKLSNDTLKNTEPFNNFLLLEECHNKINRQIAIENLAEENSLLSPDEFEQDVYFNSHPRTKRNLRANFSERRRSKRLCNLPPDKIKMKISENINSVNNKTKLKKPFVPVKFSESTKLICASNVSICSDSSEIKKPNLRSSKMKEVSSLRDTYSKMNLKQNNIFLNSFENTENSKELYLTFDKIELSNGTSKIIEPLNDILVLEECHERINNETEINNLVEEESSLDSDEFEKVISFNSYDNLNTDNKQNNGLVILNSTKFKFQSLNSSSETTILNSRVHETVDNNTPHEVCNKLTTIAKSPLVSMKCTESTKVKCASNVSICSDSFEKTHSLHETYSKLPEIEEASFLPDTYSDMNVKQDNTSLNLFENTEKAKNQTENNKIESYSIFDKNKLSNDTLKNTEPFNNFLWLEECHNEINNETTINNSELPTCTPNIDFNSSVYSTLPENNISKINSCNTEVPCSITNQKENQLDSLEFCLKMSKIKETPSPNGLSSKLSETKNIPHSPNIYSEVSITEEENVITNETQNAISQSEKCTNVCLTKEIRPSDTEMIEMASFIPKICSGMVDTQESLPCSNKQKANLELKSCPNMGAKKEKLPLETSSSVRIMQETPPLLLKPNPETILLNTPIQQKIYSKRSKEKEKSGSPLNCHEKVALIDTQQSLEKEMPREKLNHKTHSDVMLADNNTERVESITLNIKQGQSGVNELSVSEQANSQTNSSENVKCSFQLDYSNDKTDNSKSITKPIFIPEKLMNSPYRSKHTCMEKCFSCQRLFDFNCTPRHIEEMNDLDRSKTSMQTDIGSASCLCAVCFLTLERRSSSKCGKLPKCVVMSCLHKIDFIMKSPFIEKIKYLLVKKGMNLSLRSYIKRQQQLPVCNGHYNQIKKILKCHLCGNQYSNMYEVEKSKMYKFQLILDNHEIPVTLDINLLICKLCFIFLSSLSDKYTNTYQHSSSTLTELHKTTIKRICVHYNCAFPRHLMEKHDK